MLKSAMAFENLIKFSRPKEPGDEKHSRDYRGGITWSQVKEVPTFIAKLQTAARNLMEENRKLRKMHYELIAKVFFNVIGTCFASCIMHDASWISKYGQHTILKHPLGWVFNY